MSRLRSIVSKLARGGGRETISQTKKREAVISLMNERNYSTYTRQQKRRDEFTLAMDAINRAVPGEPRNRRRKMARAKAKLSRLVA